MAKITGAPTNAISAFNVEIWSDLLIEKLRATNVALAVAANSDYQGDINKAGDTVHVRTPGTITLGDYAKFDQVAYQNLAATSESLVVDEAKYFAFALDDLEASVSDQPLEEDYTREAVIAIDSLIDKKILGLHAQAATANKIGTVTAPIVLDGTTKTLWSQLVAAEKALNAQAAPQAGRWIILGPNAKSWLSKDQTLLKAAQPVADQLLRTGRPGATPATAPGYVGSLCGFDVCLSNNLVTGTATVDSVAVNYEACLFGQGKPIAYAGKIRKVEQIRLESAFATAVRGLLFHGSKVFAEYSKRLGVAYLAS